MCISVILSEFDSLHSAHKLRINCTEAMVIARQDRLSITTAKCRDVWLTLSLFSIMIEDREMITVLDRQTDMQITTRSLHHINLESTSPCAEVQQYVAHAEEMFLLCCRRPGCNLLFLNCDHGGCGR